MDSKEEIKIKAWESWQEDQKTNPSPVNPSPFTYGYQIGYKDCLKYNQETTKQVAIDFANWTQVNYWEHDDDQLWYKWLLRKETDINLTGEQLFELYLQSRQ